MAQSNMDSWVPTSPDDFNWTTADCTPALHIYEALMRIHEYPVSSTIEFLKHGLVGYWSSHNATPPGDYELLEWFMPYSFFNNNNSDDFVTAFQNKYVTFVYGQCGNELCNSWLYEGNSDQAGRGVCALAP